MSIRYTVVHGPARKRYHQKKTGRNPTAFLTDYSRWNFFDVFPTCLTPNIVGKPSEPSDDLPIAEILLEFPTYIRQISNIRSPTIFPLENRQKLTNEFLTALIYGHNLKSFKNSVGNLSFTFSITEQSIYKASSSVHSSAKR